MPVTANRGRWPKIDQDSAIKDAVLLILEWLGEQGIGAMMMIARRGIDYGSGLGEVRWSV